MKRLNISAMDMLEIRAAIKLRRSLRSKELAKKYGCSPGTIAAIASGKRYAVGKRHAVRA